MVLLLQQNNNSTMSRLSICSDSGRLSTWFGFYLAHPVVRDSCSSGCHDNTCWMFCPVQCEVMKHCQYSLLYAVKCSIKDKIPKNIIYSVVAVFKVFNKNIKHFYSHKQEFIVFDVLQPNIALVLFHIYMTVSGSWLYWLSTAHIDVWFSMKGVSSKLKYLCLITLLMLLFLFCGNWLMW